MNFQSQAWKDEVLGKTFAPGSLEARLVKDTLQRLGQVVDVARNEQVLCEIISVSLFDAQAALFDRFNIDPGGEDSQEC